MSKNVNNDVSKDSPIGNSRYCYLFYMFRDLLQNKLSDKNDHKEPLRNLIGHIYFTNSSKYRTTNHYLHTKFFACDKKLYRTSRFSLKASWEKRRTIGPCSSYARFSDIASVEKFIIIQTENTKEQTEQSVPSPGKVLTLKDKSRCVE